MSQSKKLQLEEILNQNEISLLRNIECPIDNMIPLENNAVVCKKCETVYCKDCIESWKKTNNICPMRCQPMELIPIEKTILIQQLERIQVKCKYFSYGCTSRVGVKETTKTHENECYYKQVECPKCITKVNEGFFFDHLISKCEKSKLRCFVCIREYNLSSFHSHLKSCIESNVVCEICSDYHQKESFNEGLSSECKMKLVICKKCNMPEVSCYLYSNVIDHNCISDKFSNCQFAISNYLLYLGSRIESLIEKKVKEKTILIKNIKNEYKDISEFIEKKIQSKISMINIKRKKIEDESGKKILAKNHIKNEENLVLLGKNKATLGKIQGKLILNYYKVLGTSLVCYRKRYQKKQTE